MTTVTTSAEKTITADELLRRSAGDQWFEVVEGELVPVPAAGFLHVLVVDNIYDLLKPYIKKHDLGYVVTDGLHCILSETGGGIRGSRIPDVAFIRKERLPENFDFDAPFPGAPDLAVEVASPGQDDALLIARVRDYLNAGSEQVWVVHTATQEVHVYRRAEPTLIRVYAGDTHIEADDLFPGLALPVAAVFALP